jgi:glycosyltransferase involved in cell wall biosynthesis
MKPVLVIANGFPPQGGGGVTRVHTFVRYLSQLGWQPIVLTLEERYAYSHAMDYTLLNEYAECVEIYRTKSLEPTRFLGVDFRHRMTNSDNGSTKSLSNLVHNVAKYLHHQLLVPDEKILWLPFALKRGIKLIQEKQIELVFVTTPPHSVSLIAYFLKKIKGIQYVWDIRDDWIGNPYFDSGFWHRRRLESFLESIIVRNADGVVVVSKASRDFLRQKYPHLKSKVYLIPNGFDPAIYPLDFINGTASNPKCRIIYTGSITRRRKVPAFWHAVAELRDSGLVAANNLEITLVGSVHHSVLEIINDLNLNEIVSFIGHVSQKESIEYLLMANACLLISTEEEGSQTAIPSKFYEYIGARKFVLSLASADSATADLMSQSSVGILVSPVDKDAIKGAIMRIMNLHENGGLNVKVAENWITQFDRKQLTERLANIFKSVHEDI